MSDLGRIYEVLAEQNRTMAEQGKTLAAISQSMTDTRERLFGANGLPGALTKLETTVVRHTDQISFWRGSIAVIAFVLTTALAWAGVIIGRHR